LEKARAALAAKASEKPSAGKKGERKKSSGDAKAPKARTDDAVYFGDFNLKASSRSAMVTAEATS
jgi:hypothetical protein